MERTPTRREAASPSRRGAVFGGVARSHTPPSWPRGESGLVATVTGRNVADSMASRVWNLRLMPPWMISKVAARVAANQAHFSGSYRTATDVVMCLPCSDVFLRIWRDITKAPWQSMRLGFEPGSQPYALSERRLPNWRQRRGHYRRTHSQLRYPSQGILGG
jgi:hypothetical protein